MTRPVRPASPMAEVRSARKGVESLAKRPAPPPGPVVLFIKVFSDFMTVTAGDGKFVFEVSEDMDGMDLIEVESYVSTVSTSGKPTVQIRNVTQGVDMLSTKCEIDANEKNSKDAAVTVVIDPSNDDVAWGDHVAIDVDVAGTGAKGLGVMLTFQIPSSA